MKAAVLHGTMDLRYEEVADPEIGPEEVLIKVKAAGICGSDLPRVLAGGAHYYPIILGHEFAGEIVQYGERVKGWQIGDHVTAAPLIPCHHCQDCLSGYYSLCQNYTFIGSRAPGSWAEYIKAPAINVVKLPESVSFQEGAFFEPTTVALHGLELMRFRGGRHVAVVGVGTIGLLALQCAKILGARRVTAFDIDPEKLKLASELGADLCINTGEDNFREQAKEAAGGCGFELVVETGGVPFTELFSLEIAANRSSVMYIGTPSQDILLTKKQFEYLLRKELTVRGSWMSYSSPFPGREWKLAADYFDRGMIAIDRLIDRVMPLAKAQEAFNYIQEKGSYKGKILFTN